MGVIKMEKQKKKPNGYWTKERCQKEALKYKTRMEFKSSSSAYDVACRNGWIKDICGHMERSGSRYLRRIYVFEFPDKTFYVGLTGNHQRRYRDHMKYNKLIREKSKKIGHSFILHENLLDRERAAEQEGVILKDYISKGWKPINKAKTGGLGGCEKKWTEPETVKEVMKYETIKDLATNNHSLYVTLSNRGVLRKYTKGLKREKRENGYWNRLRCEEAVNKYKTRKALLINLPGALDAIYRNQWKDLLLLMNKPN